MVAHLLDMLHHASPPHPGSGFPGSHRAEGWWGRTQAMHIQKGMIPILLQEHGGFHGVHGFTSLILGASAHTGRGRSCSAGFTALRDIQLPCPSPQPTPGKSGPLPPEPHGPVEIEAQRKVSVAGQQMHVDQSFNAVPTSVE